MVIRAGNSELVPLKDVANVSFKAGTSTITRWGGFRVINVFADLDEKKANAQRITSHLADSGFLSKLENKHGIRYAFEGQKRETSESVAGLVRGFILSFIGIFIILATIFKSYLQPLIIMMAIPFGIIGAIFGHLFMGYSLTMLSLFGLVALSGIVVNNSLLLIDFINSAVDSGKTPIEAAISSGRQRLRPIVLTSLTTVFGISSIMLERSFQAVFLIPMALSISWGLVFSTCISLLLIPALYLILNDLVVMLEKNFMFKTTPDSAKK
jgi:multidrug efflux pump subunit AcrB